MTTEAAPITSSDHARMAWDLLAESDREFAARKRLQASATIWEATVHAVMAVATHRGWPCSGDRLSLRNTIERLAEDAGDNLLSLRYVYAEHFRENADLDFMEYREMAYDGAKARDFVRCLLAMAC